MQENFSEGKNYGRLVRKNKRLSRDLSRMERIFNIIKSGIIVIDSDGDLLFINNFAKKIFGIKEDNFSVYNLLVGLKEDLSDFDKNSSYSKEFEVNYPEYRLINVQVLAYNDDDDLQNFALIVSDVTSHKQDQQEFVESEKLSSLLNLASSVAHELGNPLNSINLNLQLVKRKLDKLKNKDSSIQDLKDSIDICSEEVLRLDSIIENFLRALKPISADAKECDAITALAHTLKILNTELENLDIEVEVSVQPALPKIFADENLLKQLYFNVLKNAMEAMENGGKVFIKAFSDDDFVNISFTDNGSGISQEDISNIFDVHFTTKANGNGLGMTIINAIIRAHRGKIDIQSTPEKGTKITLSLPRKEPSVRRLS